MLRYKKGATIEKVQNAKQKNMGVIEPIRLHNPAFTRGIDNAVKKT